MAAETLQLQIGNTQTTRGKDLENINDKLKGKTQIFLGCGCKRLSERKSAGLLRALEAAKISCSRPTSVPSASGHEKMINELDSNRRSHLKAIDNAEGVLTAKESELGALKERLKELETKDVAKEVSSGLDGNA